MQAKMDKSLADRMTVPLLLALIFGGVNLRMAVSSLAEGQTDTCRRLDRMERWIDAQSRTASREDP